ncbi:MAG: hypothetical protein N2484_08405 [Clostridia bacterium]|nr:hypothetical protein [Clostridia bacterium]
MRSLKIVAWILIIPILASCSSNTGKKSAEPTSAISEKSSIETPTTSSVQTEKNKEAATSKAEALDINTWSHPTKEVLQKSQVKIVKVELLKDKTYPVFYVELPREITQENQEYFNHLTDELSKANGYWDYQIQDIKRSLIIDVKCDKEAKRIESITINGNKDFFNKAENSKEEINTVTTEISRREAGLSTIEPLDFSRFSLHQRVKELVFGKKPYKDSDYKEGIVQEDGIIINERFKDSIIQDVKIGTRMEDVVKVLGKPSFVQNDYAFYKTKDYYLGFLGPKEVKTAYIRKRSADYKKDIFKRIIQRIASNNSLQDAANNGELDNFFDSGGFVHGGGWYENSSSGIAVWQFDVNTITVYNNFEGTLYRAKGLDYDIKYEDTDYEANHAISVINGYIGRNDEFDKDGVLSPSGKLKSTFFWGNSMIHYFIIRTLDNSKPDYNVGAPAGDYQWLTDDYILYLNAWTSAPYVVRVTDEAAECESINVMYAVSVFSKDDYFQDFGINYSIKHVKDNIITFLDGDSNKTYRVEYSFDKNNKIKFKLVN